MRDIKFRGKSIDTDEWFFGTLFIRPAPPACLGKRGEDKCYIQFPDTRYMPDWGMPYNMVQGEVIPKTVGQYTGLRDKNGKEIYEGDIVKTFNDEICIVKYNYNEFGLKVIDKSKSYGWVDFIEYQIEVIGNKFDNPDLLEKGAKDE